MSRYAERIDDNTVVEYGFDRGGRPGYFYSVERMKETPEGKVAEVVEAGDTRKAMIISENEDHMNRSEIANRLEELGVREDRVEQIYMDRPI